MMDLRGYTIARTGNLFQSDADGEIVALCPQTSNCFGFNDSASAVWRLLETPQTLDAIVTALTEQYAVDTATCAADVSATLRWLEAEGLVTLERASA